MPTPEPGSVTSAPVMATASTTRGERRTDLTVLVVVALAARLPAFVAERHLTFDDGVYGASAVAMRAGGQPFRDVFSSQGPLHLPLIWVADLIGLRTFDAPRLTTVLAGLGLVVVTYLSARLTSDRTGAILAGGLVGLTGSVLWVTAPLSSDGMAVFFASLTVLLVLRWRTEVTMPRAIWLGLAVSATVSVKALLLPVAVPVVLVLLAHRRWAPILAGATAAMGSHLLLWLPWGPGNVWDQSYGYHLEATGSRTPGANLAKVLSTLGDRDLPVLLLFSAVGVGIVAARRRHDPPVPSAGPRLTSPDTLLLAWLAGTIAVLLLEHPLWRPHVSHVIPALALLIARHRPPVRVVLVALVVAVPYHLTHLWDFLHPAPYRGEAAETVAVLRSLPDGALAISDDPGIIWRSGRGTTPDLVDPSILRMKVGQITTESVLAAAAQSDVCAVVVRSPERWGSFDALPHGLADLGYRVAVRDDTGRVTYVDDGCDPG